MKEESCSERVKTASHVLSHDGRTWMHGSVITPYGIVAVQAEKGWSRYLVVARGRLYQIMQKHGNVLRSERGHARVAAGIAKSLVGRLI